MPTVLVQGRIAAPKAPLLRENLPEDWQVEVWAPGDDEAELKRLTQAADVVVGGALAIDWPEVPDWGVQLDAVIGVVEAVHGADGLTGRVRAVHASDRDRSLAGFAVIDGDHATSVDAPRHLVLVLARCDTGVALDAALGVTQELHSCHCD